MCTCAHAQHSLAQGCLSVMTAHLIQTLSNEPLPARTVFLTTDVLEDILCAEERHRMFDLRTITTAATGSTDSDFVESQTISELCTWFTSFSDAAHLRTPHVRFLYVCHPRSRATCGRRA